MKEARHFIIIIYLSHFIFERGQTFSWWEQQMARGRWMETATLTHNFFSWPYYAVLSSRPHLALLLLGQRVLNREPAVGCITACHSAIRWCSSWRNESLLAARLRPTQDPAWPLCHVGICIYHLITHTHFCLTTCLRPLIFIGVSFAENLRLMAWPRVNMQVCHLHNLSCQIVPNFKQTFCYQNIAKLLTHHRTII